MASEGYRCWIQIYGPTGARQRVINGVSVDGPAKGIRNVNFIPQGGIVNGMGKLSFDAPMTVIKNNGIINGCVLQLFDNQSGYQGSYIVNERSQTVSDAGDFANYTCPSLEEELRWMTIPSYITQSTTERFYDAAGFLLAVPGLYGEQAWGLSVPDIATLYAFTGVPFISGQTTVYAALQKLCNERFLSMRTLKPLPFQTGAGQYIRIMELGIVGYGNFGGKSGVRLTMASRRPSAMNKTNVRMLMSLQEKTDSAGIINTLVPGGNGTGFAQLTLQSLYNYVGETAGPYPGWFSSGPLSFLGYNKFYHIYRRLKSSYTNSLDVKQWEYFVADLTSVATNRQRWAPYNQSQITPISAAPLDVTQAAISLYVSATGNLQWYAQKNIVYAITAYGSGPITGMGGKTVRVFAKRSIGAIDVLNVNADIPIISVSRAVNTDTETAIDTYTVATQGRPPSSDTAMVTGMLQQIDYFKMIPVIYPGRQTFADRDYLDASNPITFTLPGDGSMIERVTCNLTLRLIPIRSTAKAAASKSLSFTVPIPALSVNTITTPSHAHGGISGGSHAHGGSTSGASGVSGSAATTVSATAPSTQVPVSIQVPDYYRIQVSGGLSANGNPLYYTDGTHAALTTGSGGELRAVWRRALGDGGGNADHGHTGIDGSGSGSIAGSAATQGISGYSGFAGLGTDVGTSQQNITGVTTAVSSTATGGAHDHDLIYGIFSGPLPTYVSVQVDGKYFAYQLNNGTTQTATTVNLDLLSLASMNAVNLNDQADHTVTITALSVGGVAWFLNGRHRETTVKV